MKLETRTTTSDLGSLPFARPVDTGDPAASLLRGERWACEAFVRGQAGPLLASIRRLLRDEEAAAGALKETFARAFRHIASQGEVPSSSWLLRAAIEEALSRRPSRRSDAGAPPPLPAFDETGHRVSPRRGWVTLSDDSEEVRTAVRRSIERLPDLYRVVLVMRDVEGLDAATTARLLDLNVNTVKVRLHRARQALREMLDPVFAPSAEA